MIQVQDYLSSNSQQVLIEWFTFKGSSYKGNNYKHLNGTSWLTLNVIPQRLSEWDKLV